MAVFQPAEPRRRASSSDPPGRRAAPARRRPAAAARSPAVRPRSSSPPPARDEPRQPIRQVVRHLDVVQDDDAGLPRVGVANVVGRPRRELDPRRLADRERAREIQRLRARRRARLMTSACTGSDGETTKWNTLSRFSPSSGSVTVPRMLRDATVNGANVTLLEPPGADVGRQRLDRLAVDFERQRDARHGLRAVIHDARGDRDAIVVLEARPLQRDRRDREVRRLARRHVDRRQRRALRQLHVVAAGRLLPAAPLEVADQNDLAPRQRGLARAGWPRASARARSASRPGRSRRLRARLRAGRGPRRSGPPLRRRTRRRPATRDRPRPSPSIASLRGGPRPRPAVAVLHAVRGVDEDDRFARALLRGGRERVALEERPRERHARSAPAPPAASPAGTSRGSAGAAPTGTGSSAGTSATGTRRHASARAGSGGSARGWRGRPRPHEDCRRALRTHTHFHRNLTVSVICIRSVRASDESSVNSAWSSGVAVLSSA